MLVLAYRKWKKKGLILVIDGYVTKKERGIRKGKLRHVVESSRGIRGEKGAAAGGLERR